MFSAEQIDVMKINIVRKRSINEFSCIYRQS
jgi:hypothetical protein